MIVKAQCPHCGKSLLVSDKLIDEQPCIEIKTTNGQTIFLSAIWNNFKKRGDRIPKGETIEAICPHCEESLVDECLKCKTCGAPLIILDSKNGRIKKVAICTKSGCHKHMANDEIPIDVIASN